MEKEKKKKMKRKRPARAAAKPRESMDVPDGGLLPRAVRHLIYCFVAEIPRLDVRVPALVERLGAVAVRDMRKRKEAERPRFSHICLFPSEWPVRSILLNALSAGCPNWAMVNDLSMLSHDLVFKGQRLGRVPLIEHPQVYSQMLRTGTMPDCLAIYALRARRQRLGVVEWTWSFNVEYWPLALQVEPRLPEPKLAKLKNEYLRGVINRRAEQLLQRLAWKQDLGGADFDVARYLIEELRLGADIMVGSAASLWPKKSEKMLKFDDIVATGVEGLDYLQYVPIGSLLMTIPGLTEPLQFPFGSAKAYVGISAGDTKCVDLFPLLYFVDMRMRGRFIRGRTSDQIGIVANFLRLGFVPTSKFVSWMISNRADSEMLRQLYYAGCTSARWPTRTDDSSHDSTTRRIGDMNTWYTPLHFE